MANYAVETFKTSPGTHAEVIALMETEIETVDTTRSVFQAFQKYHF